MTLVIRGGEVVDATGRRRADVRGRRRAGGGRRAPTSPATPSSTPAGASWRPAWSTSTPTCASPAARRPRRWRPARGRPPSAGTRRWWPCPTPSPPSTTPAWCARCRTSAASPCATWRWPAPSPSAGPASGWRRWPRWRPSACASSPTTAPACRTPASCAGPSSTAAASGVTLAQHCEDAALAGGGHMHEGEWSSRLGIPGQPAEAEELMVMRDIALARLTGARVHFQHLSTAGSVAMVRAARAAGLPVTRRGHAPPLHPHRRVLRLLRPRLQGEPAAAHRRRRGGGEGGPGRRRPRRHRHRPRAPRPAPEGAPVRPGAARDARPGDGAGPRPHRAGPADRGGAGPPVVAAGRHRRHRRPPRRPDRGRAGRPTSASSTPTPRGWSTRTGWPAGPATRPTPGAR